VRPQVRRYEREAPGQSEPDGGRGRSGHTSFRPLEDCEASEIAICSFHCDVYLRNKEPGPVLPALRDGHPRPLRLMPCGPTQFSP
jgi:hypothetical protein